MERLCDLYFEFSNEDRLKILHKLEESNLNISTLARELEMSTQECSRHMTRLSESRLVKKDSDGLYHLTQYGRLSLVLISGQRFVAKYRDYFNAHTLKRLPLEFVSRIGEMRGSELTPSVMVTFSLIESLFMKAEDHVWVMHDRYLLNILPLSAKALRRGVRIRTLDTVPKEPSLDQARPTYIDDADEKLFIKAWHDGELEVRKSDTIDLFLYVSEREAVIAFPLADGSFDYLGFHSGDQVMLSYCRDLFDFYYEKGVDPPRDLAEELHEKRLQYHREEKNT